MMNRFTVINKQQRKLFDQMVLNLSTQLFEESRHDRDFGNTIRYDRFEKVNAYGLNLDFMKKLSDRSKFLYGGELVLNDVSSNGLDVDITDGTSVNGPARYPNSDWFQLPFLLLINISSPKKRCCKQEPAIIMYRLMRILIPLSISFRFRLLRPIMQHLQEVWA